MKLQLMVVFSSSLISFFLFTMKGHAYESMIRNGYNNCMACHISATGGGLLTAYGKVMASELSFIPSKKMPKRRAFNQAMQLRGAHFRSNGTTKNFPMQLDYLMAFRGEKFSTELTLAKAPKSSDGETKLIDEFYIRKALTSYNLSKNVYIQIGRDLIDSGVYLSDHTLFIRSNNRKGITDYVTLFRPVIFWKKMKFSPFLFLPSYQEKSENKERGMGGEVEYFYSPLKASISFSGLIGRTKAIDRRDLSISYKQGLKYFSLIGQMNFVKRKVRESGKRFFQESSLVKINAHPFPFLDIYSLVQKSYTGAPFSSKQLEYGHGVNFRPIPRLSFQYDAKRSLSRSSGLDSMFQIFVNGWF